MLVGFEHTVFLSATFNGSSTLTTFVAGTGDKLSPSSTFCRQQQVLATKGQRATKCCQCGRDLTCCLLHSRQNFDSANQLNVNLSIPSPNNVHDFQLLWVHSTRHDRTLASITLPTTLVVPPYIGKMRLRSHYRRYV